MSEHVIKLPTVVVHGDKDVAVPGTAVALGAGKLWSGVWIIPKAGNVGNIYIGGATVDATNSAPVAGTDQRFFVEADNLDMIFMDADNADDGAFFLGG